MGLKLSAKIGLSKGEYSVGLSLVEFEEDGITIVYSPALDLSGYGESSKAARDSFSIALHEFLRYTENKRTLNAILKDLGWAIKGSKKNPKYAPPKDSDLVKNNEVYNDIVNTKTYKVSRESVQFA